MRGVADHVQQGLAPGPHTRSGGNDVAPPIPVQPANTAASVARDLDLTETAVREWVRQADVDDGDRAGLRSAERAELARLRQENRVLREERVTTEPQQRLSPPKPRCSPLHGSSAQPHPRSASSHSALTSANSLADSVKKWPPGGVRDSSGSRT